MPKLSIVTDEKTLKALSSVVMDPGSVLVTESVDIDIDSDTDSLFDEPMAESPYDNLHQTIPLTYTEPPPPHDRKPALRTAPPVPGLYFDPFVLLPDDVAEELLQICIDKYFQEKNVNQVMLFERAVTESANETPASATSSGIPPFLKDLLGVLSKGLLPILPPQTHDLLFPPPGTEAQARARQVIINFYSPGEGITPHVDLLDRFGDGIIGVSLGSGCVMRFAKPNTESGILSNEVDPDRPQCSLSPAWDVFLPHGSVYVMSEEARYEWTHGIESRTEDWVQESTNSETGRWVMRSIRVSITFRWLLPGADIVGGLAEASSQY